MINKIVYMDNASTTPLSNLSKSIMRSWLTDENDIYFNPSGLHKGSNEAKELLEKARKGIAESINTSPKNIYFTSGGTESDNWALNGIGLCDGDHVITSSFEHHAILHTCKHLEILGVDVTYISPNSDGFINPVDVENAITKRTKLISIMFANNEIGTIQPIEEIGKIAKKHRIIFHTDAVQAYTHVPIDVDKLNIDMMSVSGHKFGCPKGVGFLYSRIPMLPLIIGGGQEKGVRGGTENVMGVTIMNANQSYKTHSYNKETVMLRDYFIEELEKIGCKLNGSKENRLSGNINVRFPLSIKGETLLYLLSESGIYVSTGSACASKSNKPSHVLKEIGLTDDEVSSSLRITISDETTREEVDYVIDKLKKYKKILNF